MKQLLSHLDAHVESIPTTIAVHSLHVELRPSQVVHKSWEHFCTAVAVETAMDAELFISCDEVGIAIVVEVELEEVRAVDC